MPTQPATTARDVAACSHWRSRSLPALLGLVALLTTTAGLGLIVVHVRSSPTDQVLVPSGCLLLGCSYLQWRTAWMLWPRPRHAAGAEAYFGFAFWRRLFVGASVSYVAAMAIGPVQHIEYVLLAAVIAWYTALLIPLTVAPSIFEPLNVWWSSWPLRRVGSFAFIAILTLITAELGLRTIRSAKGNPAVSARRAPTPVDPSEMIALRAESDVDGGRVRRLTAGPLRVAVLLDESTASRSERNGYLARVEQILPGVEVIPVGLVRPWPCERTGEVAERLSAARPDIVLAMLSVCEDVTRTSPRASWFDWRQFELARWLGAEPADLDGSPDPLVAPDLESFCRVLAPQLAACRTPIDDAMHRRWQRTFEAVDSLVAVCRDSDVTVALVLVPGKFQVNRALCDTLARRAGYTADEIDVELPQRKLASFAAHRRLPLIDLLPQLRLCSPSPFERHAATWNDAGHVAAATAIGGWLEGRYGEQLGISTRLTSTP